MHKPTPRCRLGDYVIATCKFVILIAIGAFAALTFINCPGVWP